MLVGSYDGSVRTLASLNKNKLSEQKDTVYRNEMNIVNSANNPGGINFYATELEVYSKSRPSSNIQHIQPAEQQHAVQIQHGLEVFIDSVLLYK